jgi:hypothetical protein
VPPAPHRHPFDAHAMHRAASADAARRPYVLGLRNETSNPGGAYQSAYHPLRATRTATVRRRTMRRLHRVAATGRMSMAWKRSTPTSNRSQRQLPDKSVYLQSLLKAQSSVNL